MEHGGTLGHKARRLAAVSVVVLITVDQQRRGTNLFAGEFIYKVLTWRPNQLHNLVQLIYI